jgi:DNA-binding transcriptional ArsR family regulator
MPQTEHFEQFERFFKVLGEPQRLKIVGLLAQTPHTVEQIAKALKLGVSTVSHHLSRLADADLVSAKAEGYYSIYSLNSSILREMARTLLQQTEKPSISETEVPDASERKVLATFTGSDGRIKSFPTQEKKYLVLVRHVLKAFEHGVRYPEKRVNQILKNYNDDTARLRRSLVEYGYMAREGGGGKYWRIDQEKEGDQR